MPTGRRAVRLGNRPSVSVVVASRRERSLLEECLQSLLPQAARVGAEIVVARIDDGSEADLKAAYPDVVIVTMPEESTIPQLRAAGMAASDGDIVALTEDRWVASDDWLDQLVHSHEDGPEVAGGSRLSRREIGQVGRVEEGGS